MNYARIDSSILPPSAAKSKFSLVKISFSRFQGFSKALKHLALRNIIFKIRRNHRQKSFSISLCFYTEFKKKPIKAFLLSKNLDFYQK